MSKIQPNEAQLELALRKRLRMARAATGAKSGELAASMGVSPSTLSGWFTGSGPLPGPGRLHALCLLLDTGFSDVLVSTYKDLEI